MHYRISLEPFRSEYGHFGRLPKNYQIAAYLAVSLFHLKLNISCYKVKNINILNLCLSILINYLKEVVGFLIFSAWATNCFGHVDHLQHPSWQKRYWVWELS